MCCDCCSVKQRKAWVYGIGALLIALGTALLIFWSGVAETLVHNDLILKEGSDSYTNWVQAPIPIYLSFYMFNWTNPEEVRNRKVKPHFVEMGPYVFFEKHLKENITFHDNDTVTYYERKTWFFDPVLSNGTLDDMVTSGHAVSATVADEMRHSNKFIKKIINFILNREGGKLHVTKPVGEWIFDGFQDDLVDFLKLFNTTKINIPYNKFGWLVDRNNSLTYDGSFTLYTGVKDLTKLGLLTHWNSKNETGFYKAPCGVVNGTTGDLFPPHLDTKGEITIFATDACRFMNLQPNGTLQKHGLTAFQWVGTEETLDSGENFPNQQCFCDPRLEDCPKTGVVECKKCRDNAPIYASFPHFYLSDKSYLNAVDGLKPDPEKHKFILSVEPFTGIPVEVNGRLQINLNMIADKDFDIFRDINEFLMPLFWFDQEAYLSPELARKAKLAINLEDYGRYFGIALISCGGLFFVTGIVLTLTKKWKRTPRDDEDMLTNPVT